MKKSEFAQRSKKIVNTILQNVLCECTWSHFVVLLLLANMLFSGKIYSVTRSAVVTVLPNTRYQHIDGFGGTGMNGQWADVYTQEKVNALWGTGDDQMNFNIMRVRINPNESNWGEYGNAIKWARAINPDVQVFATPWTPPKKYKTSKTTKYKNEFGTDVWPLVEHSWGGEGSNGGAINPEYIEQYASFLERYRATMKKKGYPIDMISIQNECDYTPTATDGGTEHASYESCIFSPQEMAKMVKAAREKVAPECKIMGPECFGWGQNNYNNKLASLPDAVNSIDVWGNHIYGINDWSHINTITKKTGKSMWMTEFAIDNTVCTWAEEYRMIDNIEETLRNGFNAYVYYNMLNDFFGTGKSGTDGSSNVLYKRAYIFGHYARYATGKYRIKANFSDSNTSPITGSVYASENLDTISVFILNRSNYEYNVAIALPDSMYGVVQAVTSKSVNRKISDVSEQYGGRKRPVVKVYPGSFYTFQFTKSKPEMGEKEYASFKNNTYSNPITSLKFCAEPTAIEYNGRLYVYGTYDQQQFDSCDGLLTNDFSKIKKLFMISTEDMANWTWHGTIDVEQIAPWITASWSPSIVLKKGDDVSGTKDKFYMYFSNSTLGVGVLTADSPVGPWTDPLGKALIDKNTEGLGNITSMRDPGAVIDDNGTGWLAFGAGKPTKGGTSDLPGNARIVKLGDDMISLASDIVTIPATQHLEANELNIIGDKFVFSYCSHSSAPNPGSMMHMVSSEPLSGTWVDKGVFFKNPGTFKSKDGTNYPTGSNHAHLQKFGSNYYLIYQTQWLENKMGYSAGYRNISINKASVIESSSKIMTTTASDMGVSQLTEAYVNPFVSHPACMMANGAGINMLDTLEKDVQIEDMALVPEKGGWVCVKGVQFGQEGAKRFNVMAKGCGVIEVRLDNMKNNPVCSIPFDGDDPQNFSVSLENEISGLHSLFFTFSQVDSASVYYWNFDDATSIGEIYSDVNKEKMIFDLQGRKISAAPDALKSGIYISKGKKLFIK